MKYIPDHSTFVKFSISLDPLLLDKVLNSVAMMICRNDIIMAIDSTGFSCSSASKHYLKRMKETGSVPSAVRNYTKATLAADTGSLAVMSCVTSVSNVHDIKHIPEMLDKIASGGYGVAHAALDRGYDFEDVHIRIRERLNAGTAIPVRNMTGKYGSKKEPGGKNRKRMASSFPSEIYSRRPLIETVNSMIKRNMGDVVYGLSDGSRHKEVMFRCISHNAKRVLDLKEA